MSWTSSRLYCHLDLIFKANINFNLEAILKFIGSNFYLNPSNVGAPIRIYNDILLQLGYLHDNAILRKC